LIQKSVKSLHFYVFKGKVECAKGN